MLSPTEILKYRSHDRYIISLILANNEAGLEKFLEKNRSYNINLFKIDGLNVLEYIFFKTPFDSSNRQSCRVILKHTSLDTKTKSFAKIPSALKETPSENQCYLFSWIANQILWANIDRSKKRIQIIDRTSENNIKTEAPNLIELKEILLNGDEDKLKNFLADNKYKFNSDKKSDIAVLVFAIINNINIDKFKLLCAYINFETANETLSSLLTAPELKNINTESLKANCHLYPFLAKKALYLYWQEATNKKNNPTQITNTAQSNHRLFSQPREDSSNDNKMKLN